MFGRKLKIKFSKEIDVFRCTCMSNATKERNIYLLPLCKDRKRKKLAATQLIICFTSVQFSLGDTSYCHWTIQRNLARGSKHVVVGGRGKHGPILGWKLEIARVKVHKSWSNKMGCGGITVESRFLEPPRETKIGSRNRKVREIEGKNVVFD